MRNTESSDRAEQRVGSLWSYAIIGLAVGAAIIASAVLPQSSFGFAPFAAAVVIVLVDRIARRFEDPHISNHLSRWTIAYVAVIGAAAFAAFIVVAAVVRKGDALWLAWAMAVLVLVAIIGTWFVDKRPTAEAVSDSEKQLSE